MTERIFPAAHRRQFPGLAEVFDENAAHSETAFTTYLQDGPNQRVLTTLIEEIFTVLEFTVVPVESWDDTFDTVIRKSNSDYPIHTIRDGKPSRTALRQLTGAHTDSNVPHSILVSAVTPPSERTKRVSEHSGVRVIDQSELRELVQAAITRVTEPVHPPGTETRHPSAEPDTIERLIAKLEAACDDVDTLVDQQKFVEAAKRHETAHGAVGKARSHLPAGSANQQVRDRLAGVETGDVTTGLRACDDARSAYTDAQVLADHSKIDTSRETDTTVQSRLETVTRLERQLRVTDQIQQAEATVESLASTVADTTTAARDSQLQAKLHAAAEAGSKQVNALPDDITDPALQARITALEEQVDQFETAARHSQPATDAASTNVVTDDRSTETPRIIHTTDDIADDTRQPAPVVLRLHEELLEDGRRTVFRAETVAGDSVQFDVWHRHADAETWNLNEWYLLENIRGQQWTVANGTGVTLSTTPTFTVTSHEPADYDPSGAA